MSLPDAQNHQRLAYAMDEIGAWPNLRTTVEDLLSAHGAPYADHAEQELVRLEGALARRGTTLEDALAGYVEMTIDTLRLQAEYFKTGRFSYLDDSPGDELHQDEDLMLGRYLPGLFLAGIFWPNHHEKLAFFNSTYLPALTDGARVLDVGTGPGSYGFLVAGAGSSVLFNDLSPHSKSFVNAMSPDPVEFLVGSFLDIEPKESRFDGIVFSEIVEHLPDPEGGMAKMRELCSDEAAVFFSTATNAAFYDHTIIFETISEIEELIKRFGFRIAASQEVLATKGPDGKDVVDYNAVLAPV